MTLRQKIAKFPQEPGVYLFKDGDKKVLYVGKAKNLRKRTQSYVRPAARMETAKHQMIALAKDVEFIITDTEKDALILENTLIKKHQPPYNIVFKDDKNYVYIFIPKEKYPRVIVKRLREFNPRKGAFFGPYTSARAVRTTLKTIKAIFPYRSCSLVSKRACMDYHLGRCAGTCVGEISEEEYDKIIDSVKAFLNGHVDGVTRYLESEMERASKEKEGDVACVNLFRVRGGALTVREYFIIQHVAELSETAILRAFSRRFYGALAARPKEVIKQGQALRGQRRKLIEMGKKNAEQYLARSTEALAAKQVRANDGLAHLRDDLNLPRLPKRIEAYDISNIQGTDPVGSMVVFTNGLPDKSEYRKFHIRNVQGPNDYAMMQEVLKRRLKHDDWDMPDLMVIDGGKGQLSAVLEMLADAGKKIPVIGLAKREEEVFEPGKKEPTPVAQAGLYILQALRDEAHRFAITFYRKTARKRYQKGVTKNR